MSTILFMVSIALILSTLFVLCYLWALSRGQFDDMETPAFRILKEENQNPKFHEKKDPEYD